MKLFYRPTDKLTVEVEFESTKELFDKFSPVQEVLSSAKCGKCQGNDIIFHVRKVEDNSFYEMVCQNPKCKASLSFGVKKKEQNVLFPKRYEEDEEGKKSWLPTNGWTVWDREQQKRV